MNPENELRKIRNILLKSSDWTQMADSPLSDSKKNEWANYRQLLRDLPNNSTPTLDEIGNLNGVTFPSEPN